MPHMIISLLLGTLLQQGARRYAAPLAAKGIKRFVPSVGAKLFGETAGKGATLARGAGTVAGDIAGFGAGGALADAILDGEAAPDFAAPDVADIVYGQPAPFEMDNLRGLQRIADDAQMREMLELLGIDQEDFNLVTGGLI